MSRYDTLHELDQIVEVEKFNPFHDSRGRFSNSHGFKSYSANPNTRAGAMAISRSAAAGHGNTMNVHRESYGENIRQNANWIGRGKQQTPHQQASGTLRYRIEPANGLGGASRAGAIWQQQNAQQGRTTKPGKQQAQQQQDQQQPAKQPTKQPAKQPQQQDQQTDTKSLNDNVKDVYLSQGDKLAIQPRNRAGNNTTTRKIADDHYQDRVDGKDISATVDLSKSSSSKAPIDQMADLQGWNKAPTVTNDIETFQKAVKQSGRIMARSVDDSYTGQSADSICKDHMANADAPLGGYGGKLYGSGTYEVCTTIGTSTGKDMAKKIAAGQDHSFCYADTQMLSTVHPSAKIATPTQAKQMESQFNRMTYSERARYGNDRGAYIASKGFDGAQWHDREADSYVTMYNKSAMIYFGGVVDAR